jgi:phosphatidylserine/phosphatidylglycerophosphate/cardiolipin synthase-like enzyme
MQKKQITVATIVGSLLAAVALSLAHAGHAAEPASVEVAFSPNNGAEQLVLSAINGSQRSVRMLAYALTAAPVVRALIAAKKRGVDVAVTVDYRENIEEDRSGKAHAALAALVAAGIPVRVVSAFPIQHSKFVVIDQRSVETGSYNYTEQAARRNSENAVLITGNAAIAAQYLRNWHEVTALGQPF